MTVREYNEKIREKMGLSEGMSDVGIELTDYDPYDDKDYSDCEGLLPRPTDDEIESWKNALRDAYR